MAGILVTLRTWAKRLKDDLALLVLAVQSAGVPWYAKVVAFIGVAYALSPIDLIPDFVPVLGYVDDLVLVPLFITLALRLVPVGVLAHLRARAQQGVGQSGWGRWGAVGVVAVWLASGVALWYVLQE